MLSRQRVLDLTDDRGHLAGLLLAQMGADVVLVEPPGGHRTRHRGPYVDDVTDPERSLEFLAYNRGKRSVVVDPTTAAGVDELNELVASADIVITSGAFDVDLARWRTANPTLITAAISPFGTTGPKKDWAATDLTISAASGTMTLTGDRDRPPVRISLPQTWLNAAADTAGAVLIALHERRRSGQGQHVDSSAQQSFADCSQFQLMTTLVGNQSPKRVPGAVEFGRFLIPWVYECADGYVTNTFLFGPMMGPFTTRMVNWIHDEGGCSQELRDKDWVDFGLAVVEGRDSMDTYDEATEALGSFIKSKPKTELLTKALEDNLLMAPVTDTADVMALEHLRARGYWDDVNVERATGPAPVRFAGPVAKTTGPALQDLAPAPSLGQHTFEVHEERRQPQQLPPPSSDGTGQALADVKVVDFMWAVAGPAATRTLAAHGATVVKIESESKPDVLRGANPNIGEEGGQENGLQFHSLNAGKMGLTLDLRTSEARDVVLDLVKWADVLTESFSPRAMTKWGLGYDELKKVNPELVMFSSCLMGQTGPMRLFAGFGTMAAAIAGFYPVTGWPDRIPAGPFTAYTDYISPRTSVALIMAALEHRAQTGEGQHIDFSQLENALHYLSPVLLDQEINGRTAGRHGNADATMFPHAVFPARGDDRWIAVACETQMQWGALAELVGLGQQADLDIEQRRAVATEIEDAITRWTSALDAEAAQTQLQQRGVPAHLVADGHDLQADPQMTHWRHFQHVPQPAHGKTWIEGETFALARTPSSIEWGGPIFGQHNMEVLEGLLGYDGDRVAELVIAGAIA